MDPTGVIANCDESMIWVVSPGLKVTVKVPGVK